MVIGRNLRYQYLQFSAVLSGPAKVENRWLGGQNVFGVFLLIILNKIFLLLGRNQLHNSNKPVFIECGSANSFELSPRFSADKLYVTASVKLGEKGTKIDVKDLDLSIKIQDIHIEMECLFPR